MTLSYRSRCRFCPCLPFSSSSSSSSSYSTSSSSSFSFSLLGKWRLVFWSLLSCLGCLIFLTMCILIIFFFHSYYYHYYFIPPSSSSSSSSTFSFSTFSFSSQDISHSIDIPTDQLKLSFSVSIKKDDNDDDNNDSDDNDSDSDDNNNNDYNNNNNNSNNDDDDDNDDDDNDDDDDEMNDIYRRPLPFRQVPSRHREFFLSLQNISKTDDDNYNNDERDIFRQLQLKINFGSRVEGRERVRGGGGIRERENIEEDIKREREQRYRLSVHPRNRDNDRNMDINTERERYRIRYNERDRYRYEDRNRDIDIDINRDINRDSESIDDENIRIRKSITNRYPQLGTKERVSKIFIGCGCKKCGSTYLYDSLVDYLYHYIVVSDKVGSIRRNGADFNDSIRLLQGRGPREKLYWNSIFCTALEFSRCNWNHYMASRFDLRLYEEYSQLDPFTTLIYMEKTPDYISNPYSIAYLSYYASQVDMKLLVTLRNPVRRMYSDLWNFYRAKSMSRRYPTDSLKQTKIIQILNNTIKQWYENDDNNNQNGQIEVWGLLKKLWTALSKVSITTTNTTNTIEQDKYIEQDKHQDSKNVIVDKKSIPNKMQIKNLWIETFISYMITERSSIKYTMQTIMAKSCYMPQILLWLDGLGKENIVQEKLKIVQFEYMIEHSSDIMSTFLPWVGVKKKDPDNDNNNNNNNNNKRNNYNDNRVYKESSKYHNKYYRKTSRSRKTKTKVNSGVRNNNRIEDFPDLFEAWTNIFLHCNRPLYQLFETNIYLQKYVLLNNFSDWSTIVSNDDDDDNNNNDVDDNNNSNYGEDRIET